MLESAPIIAFVATTNGARSRDFYENVLGLRFVSDDPFALVFDANGIMLRIFKVDTLTPAAYTVLGWGVGDIHAAIAGLAAKGVTFTRYPGMQQDESGVWRSPSGAKVAWFRDPEGNNLSLTEFPR